MSEEEAGEELKVGQEGFAWVEAGPSIEAGGILEDVEQDLFVSGVGEPGMGGWRRIARGRRSRGLASV
jgi:hypothetical protein